MICIPIWLAILLLVVVASFSASIGLICAGLLAASKEETPPDYKGAEMGCLKQNEKCSNDEQAGLTKQEQRGDLHENL